MNKYGITVDVLISVGLVLALLISIFSNGSTELQTNIVSGLIGYLGKTVVTHAATNPDDKAGESK